MDLELKLPEVEKLIDFQAHGKLRAYLRPAAGSVATLGFHPTRPPRDVGIDMSHGGSALITTKICSEVRAARKAQARRARRGNASPHG